MIQVATASSDQTIKLWQIDLENTDEFYNEYKELNGHEDRVNRIIYTQDGN